MLIFQLTQLKRNISNPGAAFKNIGSLKGHQRMKKHGVQTEQTDERKFECKNCGVEFPRKGSLTRHQNRLNPCSKAKATDEPIFETPMEYIKNEPLDEFYPEVTVKLENDPAEYDFLPSLNRT